MKQFKLIVDEEELEFIRAKCNGIDSGDGIDINNFDKKIMRLGNKCSKLISSK